MNSRMHRKIGHGRRIAATAVAALALGIGLAPVGGTAQNLPVEIEALRGKRWVGTECCNWQSAWTIKSGPAFRGTFRHPSGQFLATENIIVNILDNRVEIVRDGGSGAGGCTYVGNIRHGSAGGTYSCNGRFAGNWSATIFQL